MNLLLLFGIWLTIGTVLAWVGMFRFGITFSRSELWFPVLAVVAWPVFILFYVWISLMALALAKATQLWLLIYERSFYAL